MEGRLQMPRPTTEWARTVVVVGGVSPRPLPQQRHTQQKPDAVLLGVVGADPRHLPSHCCCPDRFVDNTDDVECESATVVVEGDQTYR